MNSIAQIEKKYYNYRTKNTTITRTLVCGPILACEICHTTDVIFFNSVSISFRIGYFVIYTCTTLQVKAYSVVM